MHGICQTITLFVHNVHKGTIANQAKQFVNLIQKNFMIGMETKVKMRIL